MANMICLSAAEAEASCSRPCFASGEEHGDKSRARHGAGMSRSGQDERLVSRIVSLLSSFCIIWYRAPLEPQYCCCFGVCPSWASVPSKTWLNCPQSHTRKPYNLNFVGAPEMVILLDSCQSAGLISCPLEKGIVSLLLVKPHPFDLGSLVLQKRINNKH